MKTPTLFVVASLTAAIVLVASLVIVTGTRGENGPFNDVVSHVLRAATDVR